MPTDTLACSKCDFSKANVRNITAVTGEQHGSDLICSTSLMLLMSALPDKIHVNSSQQQNVSLTTTVRVTRPKSNTSYKPAEFNVANHSVIQDVRLSRQYCKTLYFCCILISRFWNVEISLYFNLAFSQCSTSIYQAFDGQTEFSRVFNFVIFSYLRNSGKFDAREKYAFYSNLHWN